MASTHPTKKKSDTSKDPCRSNVFANLKIDAIGVSFLHRTYSLGWNRSDGHWPLTVSWWAQLTSLLHPKMEREGLVWVNGSGDDRISFKTISNKFLAKHGD